MYKNCTFDSIPNEPMHPWKSDTHFWPVGEERREVLTGYFAAVTAMDASIGKVLDELENLNILDDTLIFFMSDNGMNMGHHGIFGKGNGTFPLNLYDTSVKIPAIAYHPGTIPAGIVCESLLCQYDFMPTLLDYMCIENTEAAHLPGKSFADILKGKDTDINENVVVYDEYGPSRMIRSREWKYIHRYPYGPHELYDLINDPGETDNLYSDKTKLGIVAEMKSKLDSWFLKYSNPDIDAAREPICGWGQVALPGIHSKGAKAFNQNEEELFRSLGWIE